MIKTRFVTLVLLLGLFVGSASSRSVNIRERKHFQQGRMRMPSATQIAADYDDGVVTVDVSRYTGTVQLYVYDANNTIVNYAIATISGSGTVTMNIGDIPKGTYRLCIVLDNATYSGDLII